MLNIFYILKIKTMYIKKNKKTVCRHHKPEIRKLYFEWKTIWFIATNFWYTYKSVEIYLNSKATKIYIDSKWLEWRRCSCCESYKLSNDYYWNNKEKTIRASRCNKCARQHKKNKYIILKNRWLKPKPYCKESWLKHGWRYKTRRRILRIIWYLNRDYSLNLKYKKL